MSMPIHYVQSIFVIPFLEAARSSGSNIDHLLERTGLNSFRVYDPGAVLPLELVTSFFIEFAKLESGPGLPRLFASKYTLSNMTGWGQSILACPDVLTGCHLAARPDALLLTNNHLSLNLNGAIATFNDQYMTPNSIGQEWTSLLSMFLVLDGFRSACGPDWLPMEIDIAASDISALDDTIDLGNAVVRTGQPANRLRFASIDLANRMLSATEEQNFIRTVPTTARGRIVDLLDSLRPDVPPTLQTIANLLDLSPRTLQRRLAEEGATFVEVLDGWRMAHAMTYLGDGRLRVSEISERLHYSNVSHFGRAFRRWTGASPLDFRDLHAK